MSLPRVGIGYETFSMALDAPAQLFEAEAEAHALNWVIMQSRSLQPYTLGGAMVWFTNEGQRRYLASDFNQPTPERHVMPHEHRLTRFGLMQLALAVRFGSPFGIQNQYEGALVQNILPSDEPAPTVHDLALGKEATFGFHTEQAANPNSAERPDMVMFGCIRNMEMAPMGISFMGNVYHKMHPRIQERLQRPEFTFHDAFHPNDPGHDKNSVLMCGPQGFSTRLGVDTKPLNQEARSALRHLKRLLLGAIQPVTLNRGEILMLPNTSTLHWDKAFEPAPEPANRRWLQRTYIKFRQESV